MCVSDSVVCDRQITNSSGSLGNMPELQTILTYKAWRANAGEGQVFLPPYGNARRFFGRIVLGPLGPTCL